MRRLSRLSSLFVAVSVMVGITSAARAEAPRIVTDVAPVTSLVAALTDGVSGPHQLVPQGASPHDTRLKPSGAAALTQADIIVQVGAGLTPWLTDARETLGAGADVLVLMDVAGTTRWPLRREAGFETAHHDHGHEDHHDEAHVEDDGHDTHDTHDEHDDHAEHDAHDHAEEHDEAHGHADVIDPHGWLDPGNGLIWLEAIAAELTARDPGNADVYEANLARARAAVMQARDTARAGLGPYRDVGFVVSHDAYQYFERAFDVTAAGAIAMSDAQAPGPARLGEIRKVVKEGRIHCIFVEPAFSARLAETVAEASGAELVALDPMGVELAPGPDLYPALIRDIATRMAGCLGRAS